MKFCPLRFSLTLTMLLGLVTATWAQQSTYPFAGQAHTGFMINKTDLSESDFPGEKPNLFVSGGLSYYIELMDAWVSGDVMFGNVDGNNDSLYFNNIFYGASLSIKFDMLKWFVNTRLKLSPRLGLGMMFYTAKLYDLESREFIIESPPYEEKPFSPNPNAEFGLDLSYPITKTMSIEVGYTRKVMFGNDYFDAFLYESPFEVVDLYSAGMIFKFGRERPAKRYSSKKTRESRDDVVEMTNDEYSALVSRIDSLEGKLAKGNPNGGWKYKEENEDLKNKVSKLNRTVDSLEANVFDFDFSGFNDTTLLNLKEDAFSEAKYHLVLCNMPSKADAQAYIERSELDRSQMHIIFVPIEKRYSILYKSFDNFLLARKERGIVKRIEPRVWIARF